MNKFIRFNFLFFSCAFLLLNPIFGMDNSSSDKHKKRGTDKDEKYTIITLHSNSHSSASDTDDTDIISSLSAADSTSSSSKTDLNSHSIQTESSSNSKSFKKEKNTTNQSSSSNSEINKLFNNTLTLHLLAGHLYIKTIEKIIATQKNLFVACINNPIGDKKQTLLMAAIESTKSPRAKDHLIKQYRNFFAYQNQKKLLVKLLIQNGADVTTCDADNNNCLHLAVKTGDIDIVNYILKAADKKLTPSKFSSFIKTKNKLGQTVFELVKYLHENIPNYEELIFIGLRKIDDKGNFLTWNLIYDDPDLELKEKTMQIWEQAFVLYKT